MNTDNKPIVDYQTPNPGSPPINEAKIILDDHFLQPSFWSKPVSQKTVLWVFVGLAFFLILTVALVPFSFNASPRRAPRVKCASNLRQIGQAIQLYIADEKSLPDNAEKLITLCDLSAEVFVCPSTNDVPTNSTNPSLKGHCSYVFLFENKPPEFLQTPADAIYAYEDPKHHEGEGANFLFADGHVDWYSKQDAKYMISELNAGYNPPRNRSSAATQP